MSYLEFLFQTLSMSVKESIVRGIQDLSLPQQIEIACHVYRLNTVAQQEHLEAVRLTHGCFDDADAQVFQEALDDSRQIETHD